MEMASMRRIAFLTVFLTLGSGCSSLGRDQVGMAVFPAIASVLNHSCDPNTTLFIDKGAADYFVKGRTDEMLQKIRSVLELPE